MTWRRRLGVQDALWLQMDRPNNLMVVDSVVWTAEPLDWDRVREVLGERLWDRYPVFRSVAVQDDEGNWWWEEVPDGRLEDRTELVGLDTPDDPQGLQELVARHRSDPLDRTQPLWKALFVDRYRSGSAIVVRTHHAIADGMRMVQLAMSLFDGSPEGGPVIGPQVAQYGTHAPGAPHGGGSPGGGDRGPIDAAARAATEAARRVGAAARGVTDRVVGAATEVEPVLHTALVNPVGAAHTLVAGAWAAAVEGAQAVSGALRGAPGAHAPLEVFSAAPGDVDVVRKLLLGTRNDVTLWTGTAGVEKTVAWSDTLRLDEVKAMAHAHGATVNDVLVACVALTLRRYLRAHGEHCASVTFMVPVNLEPLDGSLPEELGNSFALVQLELPTDEGDPLQVLRIARRRMERIKHGHEAALAFRIQELVAGLGRGIYEVSVDLLANRTVGTLTNVPGPPVPVYLARCRVDGMAGWAPLSGDQPLSFTIYSYAGQVIVGIACDRHLVPDHEMIVDGFAPAFEELRARTTAAGR